MYQVQWRQVFTATPAVQEVDQLFSLEVVLSPLMPYLALPFPQTNKILHTIRFAF